MDACHLTPQSVLSDPNEMCITHYEQKMNALKTESGSMILTHQKQMAHRMFSLHFIRWGRGIKF